jgi:hypothetical protein
MRSFLVVMTEAIVISLALLAIHSIFLMFMENSLIAFFLSGVLTHFLFEYSPFGNLNEKWCNKVF